MGNVSQKPLEVFKPPLNLTMVNETFTHNNQNNPTLHPSNNTNTQNHPTPHPMNYNFNQQHQYDVARQNLSNNTQTDTKPFIANSTQTYPLDLSTKYTNTHTPNENYTQTDPIHQSGKYTNTQIQQNNHTQTSGQSYPDRDHGIITPFYQSNYARSLQNLHMPIESMQTGQYNRLPIQSEQSRQIEYNRLPTYNTPAVTVQRPNQSIGYTQNKLIEFSHAPPLTYIQPNAQRQIEHMQTNEVAPLTYIQPTAQRQIEHMQTNVASYPTTQRPIEQTTNKPIELMQTQDPAPPNPSPQQRSIEQIQNQPIAHTQIRPIAHTQNQPIAHIQISQWLIL